MSAGCLKARHSKVWGGLTNFRKGPSVVFFSDSGQNNAMLTRILVRYGSH